MRQAALIAAAAITLAACGDADADVADEALERDARCWQQLTSVLEPVEMPSMTYHRAFMLPMGGVIAVHDDMDLDEAENLNWVALGVPGTFCDDEQQRVEQQFGDGFNHFHDMVNDVHGGDPGPKGSGSSMSRSGTSRHRGVRWSRGSTTTSCLPQRPAADGPDGRVGEMRARVLVTADEDYLREPIVDPDAKIVDGFPSGVMPQDFGERLDAEEIAAVIAYIRSLE